MLEQLREIGKNKYFRIIFALFLIIPFGLFGIEAYLARPVGGDTIANVGPARIGSSEYDNALRQQADLYRQQFRGNFDSSIMDNPEIRKSVFDRLVNEKLIAIGSERAGIRIPDKVLAERIAAESAFQVDGRFSKERYEQIARLQNLTTVALDERLREDYRQQQFRDSIAATAFVPKATLDSFIRLSEQTRELAVVNLTPDAYLARVKVSPEQVKSYYEANPKEFTSPEQVRVEYVEYSIDALAAKAEASPEEVRKAYDDGLQRNQWGQPEERRASHILVPVAAGAPEAERKAAQARAQALSDQVRKNPSSFADVAKKESKDPGSAPNGGDLGFFARNGAMVKPFEDAVFTAKKNDIVGPVASDFGFHVIRVTDLKPSKLKTLPEATPELEAMLKKQVAARKFSESAEAFSNMVYEQSGSLKPAAETLKLQVRQSPWLSKGSPANPPPFNTPKLAAEVFSDDAIKAKRNTAAVEIATNVLVAAHVIEHKPSQLRALDTVRADIERRLQRDEAMKLAKADGEAKLKELQAGKDAGLKWPAPLAVNRQKPGGLFPQVLDRAFRADPKKLPAYVGLETPAGYTLVQVTKVIQLEKVEEAQRQALGTQLRQAVAIEELEATLASLRNKVGVSVRKDALEKKPST